MEGGWLTVTDGMATLAGEGREWAVQQKHAYLQEQAKQWHGIKLPLSDTSYVRSISRIQSVGRKSLATTSA